MSPPCPSTVSTTAERDRSRSTSASTADAVAKSRSMVSSSRIGISCFVPFTSEYPARMTGVSAGIRVAYCFPSTSISRSTKHSITRSALESRRSTRRYSSMSSSAIISMPPSSPSSPYEFSQYDRPRPDILHATPACCSCRRACWAGRRAGLGAASGRKLLLGPRPTPRREQVAEGANEVDNAPRSPGAHGGENADCSWRRSWGVNPSTPLPSTSEREISTMSSTAAAKSSTAARRLPPDRNVIPRDTQRLWAPIRPLCGS
mmetsp:Transcript_9433/g.21965  ORF Transcript_9433/g.21965 Transcript_9433/m.21965 type:complete len:261 (+) Transcript_9433:156-938(+)